MGSRKPLINYSTILSVFTLVGMLLASAMGAQLGVVPLLDVSGVLFFLAGLVAIIILRGATVKQAKSIEAKEVVEASS